MVFSPERMNNRTLESLANVVHRTMSCVIGFAVLDDDTEVKQKAFRYLERGRKFHIKRKKLSAPAHKILGTVDSDYNNRRYKG